MWLFSLFFIYAGLIEADSLGPFSPPPGFKAPSTARSLKKPLPSRGLYLKPFPAVYKPEVSRWIRFFRGNPDSYFKLWLKRSYRYFPLMERIFESRGLPKELVAMSLVESNLSPHALSSAKAVGYWQFIEPTGLRFGLRINDWIDERKDFQKSALAAAKYLYQLYEEFEDWLLSMSAYNMGEARLRGLIKKHKTKNFWILYKKKDFPKETALYIPKILAAARIVKNPELYGLTEFSVLTPYSYDIFFISGGVNLKELASEAEIPFSEIKKLNPDLKSDIIPPHVPSHQLRLPKGRGLLVSKWLDRQKNPMSRP